MHGALLIGAHCLQDERSQNNSIVEALEEERAAAVGAAQEQVAAQRAQLAEEAARQAGLKEQLEHARRAQGTAEAGVARLETSMARLQASHQQEAEELHALLVSTPLWDYFPRCGRRTYSMPC